MSKNIMVLSMVIAVVFGGLGYSVGLSKGKSAQTSAVDQTVRGGQAGGGARQQGGRGGQNGNGFVSGEVIAKDDTSVTVKQRDGSTKIIFVSPSTEVTKPIVSKIADLFVGTQVMAQGKQGADGTVTATTIQVRVNMPPFGERQASSTPN